MVFRYTIDINICLQLGDFLGGCLYRPRNKLWADGCPGQKILSTNNLLDEIACLGRVAVIFGGNRVELFAWGRLTIKSREVSSQNAVGKQKRNRNGCNQDRMMKASRWCKGKKREDVIIQNCETAM